MPAFYRKSNSFCPLLWCSVTLCIVVSSCSSDQPQISESGRLDSYRKFLVIGRLESYYHAEPQSKNRYPLVRGSLTNLGNENLVVVEFTIKYKDGLNRVLYQERAYPVFVSQFSQASLNQPLGPGQKIPFAFKASNCPPTWQPGQIEIEITKIVLAK